MMRRREFLDRLYRLSMLLGTASWFGGCATGRGGDAGENLLRDIDSLRGRDYSEVGVCMLLTGENVPGSVTHRQDLGGSRLAAVLDRYARLFAEARADAGDDDVAALVELIAQRDFAAGGDDFPA